MKHISGYKLFENKDNIENDIDGILIELIDNEFNIDVKMNKFVVINTNSYLEKFIRFESENDKRYPCVSIEIKYKGGYSYNTNVIEDYVLTIIDYLIIKWGDKSGYGYTIPHKLDIKFYYKNGRSFKTTSEFPKDTRIDKMVVCVKKY